MRKLSGTILIAIPFAALFVFIAHRSGVGVAVSVFVPVGMSLLFFAVGVRLMNKSKE